MARGVCQVRKIHNIKVKWFQIEINNRILVINSVLVLWGWWQTICVVFAVQRETLSVAIYGSVSGRGPSGWTLKGAGKKVF